MPGMKPASVACKASVITTFLLLQSQVGAIFTYMCVILGIELEKRMSNMGEGKQELLDFKGL